jgi:hypothetical protein
MRTFFGGGIQAAAIVASLVLPFTVWAYEPVTAPVWSGERGSVRHLYLFPNDGLTPSADASSNSFGVASAVVSLGQYSAGWQDPDPTLDVPESCGELGSGAWDLGKSPVGSIRVTVPIGNGPPAAGFTGYDVDIQVNVVGYDVMVALPSLSAEGYTPSNQATEDSLAFLDPTLGSWSNRTWTTRIYYVTEDHVTLIVTASSSGSIIDTIEVYAHAEAVPLYTALGTPVPWYLAHNIGAQGADDWDAVDYYDSDDDSMLNWEEYVAGTDPTNTLSRLTIHGTLAYGTNYWENATTNEVGEWYTQRMYEVVGSILDWPSVSGRVYSILSSTNLNMEFEPLIDATNLPATPSQNVYTHVTDLEMIFYRIGVRIE